MQNNLGLHEELLLLALDDDKGTNSANMLHYGLGGAILAELLLAERIELDREKKRIWVRLKSNSALGDDALDEALQKIDQAKRRADLKTWTSRIAGIRRLQRRIADGLCRKGVLRQTEGKVLWVFSRTTYPTVHPGPERELRSRLESAIFSDSENVDARTTLAIALANATGILKTLYPAKRLKPRKERIERIANGDLVGEAVTETIAAVQTAVLVAVILPTIIAPAVYNH